MREKQKSFSDRVIEVVTLIPKGQVLSYSEVAAQAGSPGAARAVGNIMKKNKDLSVPCHRVICADGSLGNYNGIQGNKQTLLIQEGYAVKR